MSFSSMTQSAKRASVDTISMPAKIKSLVQAPKPEIDVTLNKANQTFTTSDRIEGVVTITPPVDTSFDEVEIEFVGTSRTFVERLTTAAAISGHSHAFHQFLKLSQPNLASLYPESRILEAGKSYDFPFLFVVPHQMLPRICQHRVQNPSVRDAHLQLPPSFGERDPNDESALDDMAPEMASVRYGVFAKISRQKWSGDGWKKVSLAVKAARVRIVAAADEQPPLTVDADADYTLRREKVIKKGLLKGKLGTLIMEAAQPKSLHLPSPHNVDAGAATTMLTVMMRFDPVEEDSTPPRLGSMSSKLKVATFFASQARGSFPSKYMALLDLSQGVHTEHLTLSSRCMASVEWTKHTASDRRPSASQLASQRRDSAMSAFSLDSGAIPEASENYKGKTYYVARLLVPVTLPTSKAFVPTFHTCLISRVYSLGLHLSLQSVGIGPSMELKVPVQISSERSNGELPAHRGSLATVSEEAVADDDHHVDGFFEPRVIRAPSEHLLGRSSIGVSANEDAPPGYSFIAPGSQQGGMSVPVY